ncbi:MAG: type II toxin-antitoxin system VapC family toxin [Fimbriimonadales bacterium]|nr:type II toxin-antitoxin system VapC family toxin [Fimbriimonadales bacterium]
MERLLLDTDVISFYLRGHLQTLQRVARYLEHYSQLELSVVSYYELRRGLVRIGASRRLRDLEILAARSKVWEVSYEVAHDASAIAGTLMAQGEKLDDADVLIAATARVLGIGVATGNLRHFGRIEGLRVENWLETRE